MLDTIDADILVLTESDIRIDLAERYKYNASTLKLGNIRLLRYAGTERRVTVYSKFEIVNEFETFDPYTSCCVEVKSDIGNLIVYGTIIGIYGNREKSFRQDLAAQTKDFRKLSQFGSLCIAGDFNMSFSDKYYFTNEGRDTMMEVFEETGMVNCTAGLPEAVDHIAISSNFLKSINYRIQEFNTDKKLSDHKGVCIALK